ncbi:MAG: hypothetical protein ACNA8W_23285 [Bradymonadaceae bacterium]
MSRIFGSAPSNVVDSALWLREKVEALVATGDYGQAIGYLERLMAGDDSEETLLYSQSYLGFLYLVDQRIVDARKTLLSAWDLGGPDAHLAYGLGHCAMAQKRWWRAVLHFLEAIHYAEHRHDAAEFMRSVGLALQEVDLTETANAMLLGALDRDLGNPWIHDALATLYEGEGMWMESLDILDSLMVIVRDATQSMVIKRTPSPSQLLLHTLLGKLAGEEAVRERARSINMRLRRGIDLVYGEHEKVQLLNTELTPMNLPPALHVLVAELSRRERSFTLLQSAQSLWARTRHERFDVMLSPFTLAASIHWIVERLHWREPTDTNQLARRYVIEADTLRAASRLVMERFQIRFFDPRTEFDGLSPTEVRRLDELQRAILSDVNVDVLRVGVGMLGS